MAKCIVTGGAGFIGSHVVDKLIALGHQVVVIDNLLLGNKDFVNPQAEFHQVDIRDKEKLTELFVGAVVIFHLAADPRLPTSIEDPITTHEINVTGTINVLQAAVEAKVKKVVFSSSCASYGDVSIPIKEEYQGQVNPPSPYGLHKLIGELYCRLYSQLFSLETVCLRYFNVFGPRKTAGGSYPMVIPTFLKQKSEKKPLTIVGDGEQTRDYVYVSDVVEANLKAWHSDVKKGEGINIGSGQQVSVNEIAKIIGGATSQGPERKGEMRFIQADNTKAKQLLGWEPTVSLEEGIGQLKKEWNLT